MAQQTAVEWLIKELGIVDDSLLFPKVEQAKEIEKQQIIDANIAGMEFIPVDPSRYDEDAEQYYTQTYTNE
jgi:hypothetical protein